MAAYAFDVTTADFDDKVLAASHEVPVVVDFWAPWCQPCRILKPLFEKLAAEYGGRFLLAKVNSDENGELAMRYGVRGIPAVKAFVAGRLVDEFTGALPEAQIRDFLDRLIPSPAAPRIDAARQARARGDLAEAFALLGEAIGLDPANDEAHLDYAELALASGRLDEARERLEAIASRCRDQERVAALQARLELAMRGAGVDVAALETRLAADPGDLQARLDLANALALQHDYRAAFDHLLEIVRRDRHWQEEAGRKSMLKLFNLLALHPEHEDLVRECRLALARTLN